MTGMVVGAVNTRPVVPLMTVNCPATDAVELGTGIVVGFTTTNEDPEIVVINPFNPCGNPVLGSGTVVVLAIARTGVPLTVVVIPNPAGDEEAGSSTVVALGTTINGVPLRVVVEPVSPAGALATGIVVAAGITTGVLVVGGPPPIMEFTIEPMEAVGDAGFAKLETGAAGELSACAGAG